MQLDFIFILGFIGSLTLGVGFVLNQLGYWNVQDFEYDFINFLGGGILAYYAFLIGSLPLFLLFIIWTLVSLKGCVFDYLHRFDWKK